MSAHRTVLVHPDAASLAAATAARLITRLIDLQSVQQHTHLVLTGGTIGIRVLECMAASAALAAVDFSTVHVWWGDERFLPTGDPERNETQARSALIDSLVADGRLDPQHVHPIPAPDPAAGIHTPQDAAAAYALALGAYSDDAAPAFDITLLGVGPDGHIASLFADSAALAQRDGVVVGVNHSPKPPAERVSLTLQALNGSREVWLVASGESKADAVAGALRGTALPAGRVAARERVLWLLDAAAAARVPQ